MADIVQAALGLERAKAGARVSKSDITGFTDPIQQKTSEIVKRNEDARENFISNLPDNYEFDLVPAEAKAKLSTYLKDKKQEFLNFADQASRYSGNVKSKEYTDAVEGMENIKAAMNKNYQDLLVAKQNREYEIELEKSGLTGYVGDELADSRRTAIIDGSTFNNIEFTDEGALINDGFGEKISFSKYKKTPARNTKAVDAIDKVGVAVRKLGRAGEDKAYLQRYVKGELGKLFTNKDFADEVYNMGFYGDTEGDTVYKNIPGATKENMVEFFTDMVINDNYAPPIAETSGSDAKDMFVTINALNKGAKIIPLPGEFGTGIVAALKSDGKYHISSGAKASAPLDTQTPSQGYSLKELADILSIKYSSSKKDPMDLNNDGRISEEEFNAAFNKNIIGDRGFGPFPQLNLPVKKTS